MWTHFHDIHSGGNAKERTADGKEIGHIYIEATAAEAQVVFYNRFGHSAHRITCTCCGEDYSVSSDKSIGQLTEYQRRREFEGKPALTLKEYLALPEVLVIRKKDIKPKERKGTVPEQGYAWMD